MKYPKIKTLFTRGQDQFVETDFYSDPIFEVLAYADWRWQEKIDGANIRLYADGTYKGRTEKAQFDAEKHAFLYELGQKVKELALPESFVLFGELFGGNVQRTKHVYSKELDFAFFDCFTGRRWLEQEELLELAKRLRWYVPKSENLLPNFNSLERFFFSPDRNPKRSLVPGADAHKLMEGFILRPERELLDGKGNRVIAKLKYKDFEHYAHLYN